MCKIVGGYYIKARKIQDSEIATAPPHIREIWDWLLKEANHSEKNHYGLSIQRGQLIRTYEDIQDGLHWMVGFRKEKYSKWQCEIAMKWLRNHDMITTMKTTRGMIITICNYDLYQDPKNYESHTKADTKATMKPQGTDTINKNDKNEIKEKNIIPPTLEMVKRYCSERKNNVDANKFYNFYESKGWLVGKVKMKDWQSSVRTWEGSKDDSQIPKFNYNPKAPIR